MNDPTMTDSGEPDSGGQQRLEDLLAERALFGLADNEERELDALLSDSDLNAEDYEGVAAQLQLSTLARVSGTLPSGLKQRILDGADNSSSADTTPSTLNSPTTSSHSRNNLMGWLMIAASILAAAFIFRPAPNAAPQQLSATELRAQLLAGDKEPDSPIVRVSWTRGDDVASKQAEGEVLWNPKTQQGVMRFRGLAKNDPKKSQYQLWIFDSERDERYPVDGGVFDISHESGDTLIPIDARLPVSDATLFAITVESPGGVVVSTRERLPLLAAVAKE